MDISTEFLRTVTLFSGLDDGELIALSNLCSEQNFIAGQRVFNYGESGDTLYVIQEGSVEISVKDTTGDKITLANLGAGEYFGELALFDPGPRSATATVTENSKFISLSRDNLHAFVSSKPSAALDLLAVMSRRLREADYLLMGRVTRNLNTEFAHEQTLLQKIATCIAAFSGSMPFLFLNALFFFIWIIANCELIPGIVPFDPYPFGFLTMSVSLEAIFLSIFVLLAQNLQSAKERLRSDVEYQINLKAELGVTELHDRLMHLQADLTRRLSGIEQQIKHRSEQTSP